MAALDSVLMAAAEKRASRYHDLGRVYKIPVKRMPDRNPIKFAVVIVASAPNGDALMVRVTARYGLGNRKVTNVFAATITPGAKSETPIRMTDIAVWFQDHTTHAPFLRKTES